MRKLTGGKDMNLIEDKDLSNIIKESKDLAQKYTFEYADCKKKSYWCDYEKEKYFPGNLSEYRVDSPIHLKQQLKDMWKFQECDYMDEYAVFLTIAAFKNRFAENEEIEISDFIYEF